MSFAVTPKAKGDEEKVASSLRRLWPTPASAWLLRNRRWLGLSFATAQATHLVAIGLDHERAGNAGGRLGPLAAADLGDERGLGLLGIGARQVAQGCGGVPGDDGQRRPRGGAARGHPEGHETAQARAEQSEAAVDLGAVSVTAFEVSHASGAPPFALRVAGEGKVVTYSGDTEWTESLVDAARGADLFIAEALFYEKRVKYHLDLATLLQHRARLECRRLVLTHMGEDMLRRLHGLDVEAAEDGKQLIV